MSDKQSQIQQIVAGAGADTRVNENFDAMGAAAIFGRDARTTQGLTWGYVGGRWGGALIPSGTLALPASQVSYIVADAETGVPSASQTDTDWLDTGNVRLYKVTAGAGSFTDWEDHRAGPRGCWFGGTFSLGGDGGGGGGGDAGTGGTPALLATLTTTNGFQPFSGFVQAFSFDADVRKESADCEWNVNQGFFQLHTLGFYRVEMVVEVTTQEGVWPTSGGPWTAYGSQVQNNVEPQTTRHYRYATGLNGDDQSGTVTWSDVLFVDYSDSGKDSSIYPTAYVERANGAADTNVNFRIVISIQRLP